MGEENEYFSCDRTVRRIGAVPLRYAHYGRWAEARLVRRAEKIGRLRRTGGDGCALA